MENERFDAWTRELSSRRVALAGLAGGGLAVLSRALGPHMAVQAKKKRKKKKCKRTCPTCQTCVKGKCKLLRDGTDCGAGRACADGACVVDQGTCAAGENVCAGTGIFCNDVPYCRCFTTTVEETRCGQADPATPCGGCVSDGDCRDEHGPGAFCARGTEPSCGCPADKPNFCRKPCPV
jgi:hypothetical protein